MAENILNDLFEKGEIRDVDELNLTNTNLSHDFQFLINAHDSILRWFFNWFGHAQQNSNKLAQQSVEEIKDSDSASLVLPNVMLNCRKKFIEEFNALTGTNATVEFSKLWKNEEKEIMQEPEENKEDNSEENTEEKGE